MIERYAGRGMAVVGFEMDQVIPGAGAGGVDVRVPITQAYNHHFESVMVGNKSTLRRVRLDGHAHAARHGGHGLPAEAWEAVELGEGVDGLPTHLAFGGANGGEYR